mmetsp:Transcript_14887/g.63833  ORF Transcript_14887/g.63833 Transcript_14887/m.63833 type:complete len:270 (-) Transcript_14887:2-811(-)
MRRALRDGVGRRRRGRRGRRRRVFSPSRRVSRRFRPRRLRRNRPRRKKTKNDVTRAGDLGLRDPRGRASERRAVPLAFGERSFRNFARRRRCRGGRRRRRGGRLDVSARVDGCFFSARESARRASPLRRRRARLGDGASSRDEPSREASRVRIYVVDRRRRSRKGHRRDRCRSARHARGGEGEAKGGPASCGGDPRARPKRGRRPRTGPRVRPRALRRGSVGAGVREEGKGRERAPRGGGAGRRGASRGKEVRGELALEEALLSRAFMI